MIFQDISRLTVEDPADSVKRRKPDSGDLAGFDFGKIGIGDADLFRKFAERYKKPVFRQIYDNIHPSFTYNMKWTDIGKNARKFEKTWRETTGEEKKYDQSFINDFFSVYGVSRDKYFFQYTVRLKTGEIRWADCFWPGVVLIEMKSKGQNKAELETAYAQALEYYYAIEEEIRPKFILVCDFNVFELYNMDGASEAPTRFTLKEFPTRIRVFDVFLGIETKWKPAGNDDLNIKAAYMMAKLHDKMAALGYSGHELEVYLVRLMFCLFAEDTEIFGSGFFYDYIQGCKEDGSDLGGRISVLFEVLDMPPEVRAKKPMLSAELKRFQYINGSLFAEIGRAHV